MGGAVMATPGRMTMRILMASLIGSIVEFYDFYTYATAASLVFGPLFFPAGLASAELIAAYASFGVAFLARPLGGMLFGHFGDRIGRKSTLVASLLLMGGSTLAIGVLPTYQVAGWTAPALLCLLRLGQGLSLGGEWTGAALLALENAPPGWRARFAMFAPLGAPVGFILANGLFLGMTVWLSPEQFHAWGWRVPFLASVALVAIGLWVRLSLGETKEFTAALAKALPPRVPLVELLRDHKGQVALGTFGVVACFSLYYTVTTFTLGYGTTVLGHSLADFLLVELAAIPCWAVSIVLACWLADHFAPTKVLIAGCLGAIASGLALAPLLEDGSLGHFFVYIAASLLVMGFVNGPLAAWLPSLFPARVRYTGTALAFNVGGILGGAFTPMISQGLSQSQGLAAVGFYLAVTGGISLLAFDISARKATMGALMQSEERYRSLFEQAHVCLCELDLSRLHAEFAPLRQTGAHTDKVALVAAQATVNPDFLATCAAHIQLVDANEATARLLGCRSDAEVLGPLDRFLPPEPEIMVPLLAALVADTGRESRRFEGQTRMIAADGRPVMALWLLALPADPLGLDRVSCAMVDVTACEQAQHALLAAQAELARAGRVSTVGAISATIAHEVNQPISAMVMSAQACLRWLRRSPPDLDAAVAAAERAVRDGLRASQIVERTREQLRQNRPRLGALDLRVVAEEALALLEREVQQAGASARTRFIAADTTIIADRVEIQQVLINLMTNGLHAMADTQQSERVLEIGLTPGPLPDLVRLWVRDHGTGIAPDNLARLFDPFFTTKEGGMGVGLAICKTIVEAHGGTLSGRNHEEGGALFEVSLPLAQAADLDGVPEHAAAGMRTVS